MHFNGEFVQIAVKTIYSWAKTGKHYFNTAARALCSRLNAFIDVVT